jgi:hypothetical protein
MASADHWSIEGSPVALGALVKKKRIVRTAEVTIETEETVALRGSQGRGSSLMWCPACRRQVEMVSPDLAAQAASVPERTIFRWVESGQVHFTEVNGHLLICASSLSGAKRTLDGRKR